MKILFRLCLMSLFPLLISAQSYRQEVRGVWITNVDSDILNSKDKIAKAMDYLAANGFNVVYPVVWNKGYTQFPSTTLFTAFGVTQDPYFEAQKRDPLQEIIVEAHRVGMEVIPWFEFGFSSDYSTTGGYILKAKPSWASKNSNGFLVVKNGFAWMNGFHPEVQDFMLGMMEEVAQNYDVDGVQGDDRLPAMPVEAGYDAYTSALYKKETGSDPPTYSADSKWIQWRSDKLTNYLGRIYRRTKAVDKNLIVSMSPSIFSFSRDNYLQDWPRWLDSNYVDIIHPQVYRYDINAYQSEIRNIAGGTPSSAGGYIRSTQKAKVSAGVLIKAGATLIPPKNVLEEVKYHRQFGLGGEVFFFYEGLGSKNQFLADSLHKYIYTKPAVMPTRKGLWRPDAVIVNENDAAVTKTGTWATDTSNVGYTGGMVTALAGTDATITYKLKAPYTGTYEVFAFDPRAPSDATTNAQFSLKVGNTIKSANIDQKTPYTVGWERLSSFKLDAGAEVTVTLKADAFGGGKTYADAVMLLLNRKATPDLNIPITISTANETEEVIPRLIFLGQNNPNPFQNTAEFNFTLSETSPVTLKVFDLLGREVQTIVNEIKPAGTHRIIFDAKLLSNGVYLYQIEAQGQTQTRRMVIMK